ncbi:MAG TPA: AAA family ATPase, partial [Thermoanaerobaculia bacterium]
MSLLESRNPSKVSLAKGHLVNQATAMPLHPVLLEKLNAALAPASSPPLTRRDARLPGVPGKVHAVIGMRRAGKTTFLRQLQAARRENLPSERAVFVSFDDDRLAELAADQLALLLEEYCRRYPELRNCETVHWLLDEIQLVAGWERFVRRVLDSERVEIVVSGSSARMLSREVHTSLRGRGMETSSAPSASASSFGIAARSGRGRGARRFSSTDDSPGGRSRRLRWVLVWRRFLTTAARSGFAGGAKLSRRMVAAKRLAPQPGESRVADELALGNEVLPSPVGCVMHPIAFLFVSVWSCRFLVT